MLSAQVDDYIVVFNGNRERLGDVRARLKAFHAWWRRDVGHELSTWLNRHFVASDQHVGWIEP
jgi:hypothetical protein